MNLGGGGATYNSHPVRENSITLSNSAKIGKIPKILVKKKKGFTLAEVLITLGVIGIVAALTIPNLARKWEERAIISKYKKMYATLSNAYNRAVADKGDPEYWDLSDKASILKILEPYLNVAERCYNKKGCVSDGNFNSLSGAVRYGRIRQLTTYPKLRLNGGFSLVVLDPLHNGCEWDTTYTDINGNTVTSRITNDCGTITGVITNAKGKNYINYLGKDHFVFQITPKGIYPYGYKSKDEQVKKYCKKGSPESDDPNYNTNGQTCGTWILRYDNMDYFYE